MSERRSTSPRYLIFDADYEKMTDMKKTFSITIGLIISLICLTVSIILTADSASAVSISDLKLLINGDEEISLWEDQSRDTVYVFLPSCAELSETTFLLPERSRLFLDDKKLFTGRDCSDIETGREYVLKIKGSEDHRITFLKSENIPSVYIRTGSGSMDEVHADKEHKEDARITIYTSSGDLDYSGSDQIRGHGNSTWNLSKKAYNLHLHEKADLLGMGKGKKWVLLANAYDDTNLRNKLILDFARDIESYDGFSPECTFVDLYLNGEYNGLYLLTESVKDVTSSFMDTDSDDMYEIEMSLNDKIDPSDNFVPIHDSLSAIVKYPSPFSDTQEEELKTLFQNLNSWMSEETFSSSTLSPDLESLARKFLIETVFENYDAALASQYFWGSFSDGAFYAGPCWDYDLSMGNFYMMKWNSPYVFPSLDEWTDHEGFSLYSDLWNKDDFRNYTIDLYRSEFHDRLTDLIDNRIDQEAQQISSSMTLEQIRWPVFYKEHDSFTQSTEDLKLFMKNRIAFLDSCWIAEDEYCKITMKLPFDSVYHMYVLSGTTCDDLPKPSDLFFLKTGLDSFYTWYYADTNEPFDPQTAITSDIILYADLH